MASGERPKIDREVRVAEEAERERGLPEDVERLDLAEDVGVLVDRGAVGDGEGAVDHDRALGQRAAASGGSTG
jgi:hypothetical protein